MRTVNRVNILDVYGEGEERHISPFDIPVDRRCFVVSSYKMGGLSPTYGWALIRNLFCRFSTLDDESKFIPTTWTDLLGPATAWEAWRMCQRYSADLRGIVRDLGPKLGVYRMFRNHHTRIIECRHSKDSDPLGQVLDLGPEMARPSIDSHLLLQVLADDPQANNTEEEMRMAVALDQHLANKSGCSVGEMKPRHRGWTISGLWLFDPQALKFQIRAMGYSSVKKVLALVRRRARDRQRSLKGR